MELRVEDKDRASLAVVQHIFTGLHLLGCLAPENDAVMRPADKPLGPMSPPNRPAPLQTTTSDSPAIVISPKPVPTIVPNKGNFPKRPDRSKLVAD